MAIHLTIRQCIDMLRLAKVLLGLYGQDLTGASSLQCPQNAFARMSSATTISVLRCACRSVIASAGPEDLAGARDDLYHARHVLLDASINRPHRTRWLTERSILYAEVHLTIEHIRGADPKGRSSENYTKNHNKKNTYRSATELLVCKLLESSFRLCYITHPSHSFCIHRP